MAEIYYKAFPEKFLVWIVGMVIKSRNESRNGKKHKRFLVYLLAYTKTQGEDSVRNLQDEYKALWNKTTSALFAEIFFGELV